MKKLFFLFLMLLVLNSSKIFAQFLKVDKVEWKLNSYRTSDPADRVEGDLRLSNGEHLLYKYKRWSLERNNHLFNVEVETNFVPQRQYSIGTIVYKSGNWYEIVEFKKVGTYTIKYAKERTVSAEIEANITGNYSFRTFSGIFFSPRADGSISGSAKGGTSTIVNVVFDNDESVSLKAGDDPLWLEAKAGMKVEHYKLKHLDIYKLIF